MLKNIVSTSYKEVLLSWKESLELLVNKRFWLVTIKGTLETYRMLLKKFWWLVGFCILFDISYRANFITMLINNQKMIGMGRFFGLIIWFLLWCLLGFITFLIARPSLEKKECSYFISYWKTYWWFVVVTGSVWLARLFVMQNVTIQQLLLLLRSADYIFFLGNFSEVSTIYFSPLLVLYTFFYMDSQKNSIRYLYRFWSAIKMVFYTYPFCFIMWCIVTLVSFFISFVIHTIFFKIYPLQTIMTNPFVYHLVQVLVDDWIKLLLPLFICLMNNLYTKQVHDHFDRYA